MDSSVLYVFLVPRKLYILDSFLGSLYYEHLERASPRNQKFEKRKKMYITRALTVKVRVGCRDLTAIFHRAIISEMNFFFFYQRHHFWTSIQKSLS